MKIDIFSDLHLDHWMLKVYRDRKTRDVLHNFIEEGGSDANVVIFAGDAGNGSKYHELVMGALRQHYKHVIGTPGNHDFYRQPGYTEDHFIESYFSKVSFASCPLWTNFRNKGGFGELAEKQISDWLYVPELVDGGWRVTHAEYYKYREKLLFAKPDVAVTHFSPIVQSVHPRYAGDALNPYFCNDDEEMFNAVEAKLWVHGHTHSEMDYMHNNTRVVAHPIGYPYENYSELIGTPMKTVEI